MDPSSGRSYDDISSEFATSCSHFSGAATVAVANFESTISNNNTLFKLPAIYVAKDHAYRVAWLIETLLDCCPS